MFFITSGNVYVYINGVHINTLKAGEFFGEIAMFLKSHRRTATVKTMFYCDLFYISRADMEKLTYDFS